MLQWGILIKMDFRIFILQQILDRTNFIEIREILNLKILQGFPKRKTTEGFATGATMLDINNDGWMDIYVSRLALWITMMARRNKLFVNQQDGTFKEEAKMGFG